jgi:hypothetical protein
MGVRVLCTEESLELEDDLFRRIPNSEEYDLYRLMLGIPESSKEIGN